MYLSEHGWIWKLEKKTALFEQDWIQVQLQYVNCPTQTAVVCFLVLMTLAKQMAVQVTYYVNM
jgi:hypothetical protein